MIVHYLLTNQPSTMPQPPFEVAKYLSKPLPHIRESYPPGTGGTGPRASWDGNLKGVEVIDDLDKRVTKCTSLLPSSTNVETRLISRFRGAGTKRTYPTPSQTQIPKDRTGHLKATFGHQVSFRSTDMYVLAVVLEESRTNDVALSTLPLAAVSSVLTALDADKEDAQLGPGGARALDTAGYESVSFCPS